ncbi:hypothetical protein [Streptomyces sp. NPDC015130]|uniref:hypothetical protein n=1 Tax=Streptomyces sp. NPDC015130 TaxID=3364940 RepID=UPI00370334CF
MTDAVPSRFLRLVLRVDTFAKSRAGIMTLIPVLLVLVTAATPAGFATAGVLFAVCVLAGVVGRRYERSDEPLSPRTVAGQPGVRGSGGAVDAMS